MTELYFQAQSDNNTLTERKKALAIREQKMTEIKQSMPCGNGAQDFSTALAILKT